MDFIVIDTEGRDILSQLAVVNSSGKVIYEAFAKESLDDISFNIHAESLKNILKQFGKIAHSKTVVCHFAKHDIEVLKKSYKYTNLKWPDLKFDCSYELSRNFDKTLTSYSLEYLSSFLALKVDGKYFQSKFAHTAKYDALFTYELYQELKKRERRQKMTPINPFASSRVDNPFQTHSDVSSVYKKEFDVLGSAIKEIKLDPNHQSRGLVVLGEPGSGKTHLMMRLVKKNLKNNRIFFIRQPNHPDFIVYHIYSKMLESFLEKVPGTKYSQLEYLLVKSFAQITIESLKKRNSHTQKDKGFIDKLSKDSMNLYTMLGAEGSQRRRDNWKYIENKLIKWWGDKYGLSGYSEELIKGLVKFCSYSEDNKRKLIRKWLSAQELTQSELKSIALKNWSEDISKEVFSFDVIELFGKLSLQDEPLIIIFDQLEGLKYDDQILQKFGMAIKELLTQIPNSLVILNLFPDRWNHFEKQFDNSVTGRFKDITVLNKPSQSELKQILGSKAKAEGKSLNELFMPEELEIIVAQNSIREVLNCASQYYRQKIYNIPIAQQFMSFEEEVKAKLSKIQKDINILLQHKESNFVPEQDSQEAPDVPKIVTAEPGDNSSPGKSENSFNDKIVDYINNEKQKLKVNYGNQEIIDSTHDIGKLRTIMIMYQEIKKTDIDQLMLGKKKLPEHLKIEIKKFSYVIGFLHEHGTSFTSRIKNFNQLVINHEKYQFRLFRDVRERQINGKQGKEQIAKFNNADNGKFLEMDKNNRILFELIYKLIVEIQNKDVDFNLKDAFDTLKSKFKDHWLIALLQ